MPKPQYRPATGIHAPLQFAVDKPVAFPNNPTPHATHAAAPTVSTYWPTGHTLHDCDASVPAYRPTGHVPEHPND